MNKLKLSWINFYKDYFNIIIKPEQLKLDKLRGCQVFIAKGLSLLLLARALRDRADCYEVSPHLDEAISSNLRSPQQDYIHLVAIKVKAHSRSRVVFLSKDITLLEVLVFQLKYFHDEGKFFPRKKIICAGTEGFGEQNPVVVLEKNKLTVEFVVKKS